MSNPIIQVRTQYLQHASVLTSVGRSSHVCNGGFLVTEAARNRGVGRLMGEGQLLILFLIVRQ